MVPSASYFRLRRRSHRTPRRDAAGAQARSRWRNACLLLLTCAVAAGWYFRHRRLAVERETRAVAATEDLALAHERLDRFLSRNSRAVTSGLFDLQGGTDVPTLRRRLALLEWTLRDDYLLEMNGHHRLSLRDTSKSSVFSLHGWITEPEQGPWRNRLLELLAHADREVRDAAARSAATIARKLPECLADPPLEPFSRRHLGLLLEGLARPLEPGEALEAELLIEEALLRPGQLRVWRDSATPFERGVLPVILCVIERAHADGGSSALLASVAGSLPPPSPALAERWVAALEANASETAQELLLGLALDAGAPLRVRLRALAGIGRCGAPRHAEALRQVRLPAAAESALDLARQRLQRRAEFLDGGLAGAALEDELVYLGARPQAIDLESAAGRALLEVLAHGPVADRAMFGAAVAALDRAPIAGSWGELVPALLAGCADPSPAGSAAARLLAHLCVRRPGSGGGGGRISPGEHGPFPLEVAADPGRRQAWLDDWSAWWETQRWQDDEAVASWYMGRLGEAAEPDRTRAAVNLALRARLGLIPPRWYAEHRERLGERRAGSSAGARLALLTVLERCGAAAELRPLLWRRLRDAFAARAYAESWAVLRLLARLYSEDGVETSRGVLVEFLARLARAGDRDSHLGLAHRFLVARFGADTVDEEIVTRLHAVAGAFSGQLVRYFPEVPDAPRVRLLLELLDMPDPQTRFWASTRLRQLAGEDFGFTLAEPADSERNAQALERARAWVIREFAEPGGGALQSGEARGATPR